MNAISMGIIAAVTGDGKPRIDITFESVEEMHAAHATLVTIATREAPAQQASAGVRERFEAFFLDSRRGKGVSKRETLLERLEDGTYAQESTQRHWWTWQNALAQAAPQQPGQSEEALTKVARTAPDRIYLVIGEDCPEDIGFGELAEVTWCEDKIDRNSIPYVRADLTQPGQQVSQGEAPAGFVLVPVEPTEAMRIAGNAKSGMWGPIWRAMIAAARPEGSK